MNGHHPGNADISNLWSILPFAAAIGVYVMAAFVTRRRYTPYSPFRYICWMLGVGSASVSLVGPLASRAHTDFAAHMTVHLLLGMLSPLLLALAAPITLLFRSLRIREARRLSRLLKSAPFRWLNDPAITAILHIGGLWLLYTTDLYDRMHHSFMVHAFVHFHLFIAGYLFTVSILSVDPAPHRTSFGYRSVVLLLALTGHGILSKYVYAHPPAGVPASQAEAGSMLMFNGGDLIDMILIFVLFLQWFRSVKIRPALALHEK